MFLLQRAARASPINIDDEETGGLEWLKSKQTR